jgi:hypothetical protein
MSANAWLVVASAVFVLFIVWRFRPSFGKSSATARLAALKAAKAKVTAATNDHERALALCDAGDAAAAGLTGSESAIGFYLRAMRASPQSAELVARAAKGLARKPRALESLMWRRLGAEPWQGAGAPAAKVALGELARLYEGPLRSPARARAIENALVVLGSGRAE